MGKIKFNAIIIFAILLLTSFSGMAQLPTHYPTGDEKVAFNLINILIFFIVPVLLLVFYIYWLRAKRKKREKEKEE
ncbi:MAG: hypothetical protein ACOCZL_03430 [Bacteroidota bacterium]